MNQRPGPEGKFYKGVILAIILAILLVWGPLIYFLTR